MVSLSPDPLPLTPLPGTLLLLVGMGLGLVGYLTLTTIVANWFERRRNTAIALTQSGGGIGGLLLPVVALALAAFGWRSVAFSSGIFVLVLGLPIAQLMRHKPEAHGLLPDGDAPPDASGEEANTEGPEQGDGRGVAPSPRIAFTARQALRTPTFWLLAMGHGMAVFVGNGLSLHLIAHIVARLGISLGAAAGVITLIPVATIGAQVIGGYVGDRVNKRILAALCMVGIAVSLVLFAFGEGLGNATRCGGGERDCAGCSRTPYAIHSRGLFRTRLLRYHHGFYNAARDVRNADRACACGCYRGLAR